VGIEGQIITKCLDDCHCCRVAFDFSAGTILKLSLWVPIIAMSISLVAVFNLVGGCRPAVSAGEEKPESEEALRLSEQPDKELFDKYFSYISLDVYHGLFWDNNEKNITALLPHQEASLMVGFKNKNKNNFVFMIIAV